MPQASRWGKTPGGASAHSEVFLRYEMYKAMVHIAHSRLSVIQPVCFIQTISYAPANLNTSLTLPRPVGLQPYLCYMPANKTR